MRANNAQLLTVSRDPSQDILSKRGWKTCTVPLKSYIAILIGSAVYGWKLNGRNVSLLHDLPSLFPSHVLLTLLLILSKFLLCYFITAHFMHCPTFVVAHSIPGKESCGLATTVKLLTIKCCYFLLMTLSHMLSYHRSLSILKTSGLRI